MSRTDEELTRLFERAFADQSPGDELWESTRASMRRKVRARQAMVVASVVVVAVLAAVVPQVFLAQRTTPRVDLISPPPGAEETEAEPGVSYTEKPFHLALPRHDDDASGPSLSSPQPTAQAPAEPSPSASPVPSPPASAPADARPERPADLPPPITFTSHRSGDRVPAGEVTVGGNACTYESTVYLTILAPDGNRTDTWTMAHGCDGPWEHTFVLSMPGAWTITATEDGGDGTEGYPPYQTSLRLEAY